MQSPGVKESSQRTTWTARRGAWGRTWLNSTAIAAVEDARRIPGVEGRSTALEMDGGSTEIFEAPADLSALPVLMGTE